MEKLYKDLESSNYIDEKGYQGMRVDRNRDGQVVGFATNKDGLLNGPVMSRNRNTMDLWYIGHYKSDQEIGFWICTEKYV